MVQSDSAFDLCNRKSQAPIRRAPCLLTTLVFCCFFFFVFFFGGGGGGGGEPPPFSNKG